MSSLTDIRQRFQNLQGKEIDFANQAIGETSDEAMKLNVKQLSAGVKIDGEISNYIYQPSTIKRKKKKAGLSGITTYLTNYDTGDSYRNMYSKVDGDKITFGTDTVADKYINTRMDEEAFGLTGANKSVFLKDNVNPLFIEKIKAFLNFKD